MEEMKTVYLWAGHNQGVKMLPRLSKNIYLQIQALLADFRSLISTIIFKFKKLSPRITIVWCILLHFPNYAFSPLQTARL